MGFHHVLRFLPKSKTTETSEGEERSLVIHHKLIFSRGKVNKVLFYFEKNTFCDIFQLLLTCGCFDLVTFDLFVLFDSFPVPPETNAISAGEDKLFRSPCVSNYFINSGVLLRNMYDMKNHHRNTAEFKC